MEINKELIDSYQIYVLKQIYWEQTPEELQETIRKNKITTRIIESKWIYYFWIYKWTKLLDQNNLELFQTVESFNQEQMRKQSAKLSKNITKLKLWKQQSSKTEI